MNPKSKALGNKIQLGSSKSGPCEACRKNAALGKHAPPLHANCRCKYNK